VLLVGVVITTALGHALEYPGKMRLDEQTYMAVQMIRTSRPLSDCEDDLAEWAAVNEVTQSICRLSQGERLCHDRLDRTGFK
jgi:hypothetical protein